jgi:hypothetical protein
VDNKFEVLSSENVSIEYDKENGLLHVNCVNDLIEDGNFNEWLRSSLIPGWYGIKGESIEDTISADFDKGVNSAVFKIGEDGKPIGYISGKSKKLDFNEVANDLSNSGFSVPDDFAPKLDAIGGESDAMVFMIYGCVVDPEHRGEGISKVLIEEVLKVHNILYGETRNFTLIKGLASKSAAYKAYFQFGFLRMSMIPDWANTLKPELSLLIRSFWKENLQILDELPREEYIVPWRIAKKYYRARIPSLINRSVGKRGYAPLSRMQPLHVFAPRWIPREEPKLKGGEQLGELHDNLRLAYRYLRENPNLYMPLMYVKAPRRNQLSI